MPDPKLDIKITTSGAAQSAREIEGVGSAAGKAGQAAVGAGKAAKQGFDQFSRAGNDAANVITGLETASKGGIAGIFGIAGAMRALIGIVRGAVAATGPLGLLVTLLGTGLAAAMAIFSRQSKDAEGSVEALKQRAQELGKIQFEQLKGQLSSIAEMASDAISEFDRLAKAANEVDRAATSARIAKIKARTDLSAADKLSMVDAEEFGLSQRGRAGEIRSLETAVTTTDAARAAALDETSRAGEKLQSAKARLADLQRRRDASQELTSLRLSGSAFDDPVISKRISELEEIVGTSPKVTDADIASAKEEVDQFTTAVGSAESALAELTKAFVVASRNLETARETSKQVGASEKEERAANLDVALRSLPQPATAAAPSEPLIEPSTERTDALGAQIKALKDANTAGYAFGGDPKRNHQIAVLEAAFAESKAADEQAMSVFTAQVQASAASRQKMAREMAKAQSRANDRRP